jgi:fructose PTS system EIIBC or EIIC component
MKLYELLKTEFIIADLKSSDKKSAINQLIDLFENDERVKDIEKVRESVFAREMILSTGVGKGFALPHGKTSQVNDILAAFAKSSKPINYEALDNQPVQLLFLLVGKESMVSYHIKLISRISRMMNNDDFRKKLIEAGSSEEILEIFRKEEESYNDVI